MSNQDSISMSENLSPPIDEALPVDESSSVEEITIAEAASTDEVKEEAESRRLPKGKLEAIAIAIMVIGFLMIFQPLNITLYSYSFVVIIIGTLMFIIVSHFPED